MNASPPEGNMIPVRTSKLVWLALLLVVLSVVLLVYPVETRLEYRPVESPDAIVSMPVFALVFYTWMALLMLLLWRAKGANWSVFLIVLFALVYLGFWNIHLPEGTYEDWAKMADIPRIQQEGQIPSVELAGRDFEGHPGYLDFPAIGIWGLSASEITGQEIPELRGALVLLAMVTLGLLLLAFYRRSLGRGRLALLAAVLAIMGNAMLARFHFHPAFMVLLLLAATLVLLARAQEVGSVTMQDKVALILLAAAAATTHLVTSSLIFFIAAILYLFHLLRRGREQVPLQVTGVALLLALTLTWSLYWATSQLSFRVSEVGDFFSRVNEGDVFWYIGAIGRSNVEQAPFWANITRLSWLGGFYGLALVLALLTILRIRKVTWPEGYYALILVAIGIVTVIGTLVHHGGEQYYRLITYGSFVAAPLILLRALQARWKTLALGAIAVLAMVLSLPSFLAHNNNVNTASFYPSEVAAGKFLHAAIGGRDDQTSISVAIAGDTALYYNPQSEPRDFPEFVYVRTESDLIDRTNEFMASWVRWRETSPYRYNPLVTARKWVTHVEHWLGKEAALASEDVLNRHLAKTNRFYDNGMQQFYE